MVVLDTNVVSELMRPEPAAAVRRWVGAHNAADLFTTTIAQAEVLYGVALMKASRRKTLLQERALQMFQFDFAERMLPFDGAAAVVYAQIAADRRLAGRPITPMDAEMAAIALSRGAVLATRNTRDFEGLGLDLYNPWDA